MIYRFGAFTLDAERMELRRDGERVPVEPQVFSLLLLLIENRDRVVSKDEIIDAVWEGRAISDATLSTRINAARKAVDDTGKDQNVIRTAARRGFRFVAEVGETPAGAGITTPAAAPPEQDIRFCTAPDGARIAYACVGDGPPLVKTANWLNHLEFDWESPVWKHMFRELAAGHKLIRYDSRGNGLSDWDVDDISFEALVGDLETVMDIAAPEKVDLFGISQGCAVAVAYAVRHPDRVKRLVLHGGYAAGWEVSGTPEVKERQRALLSLIKTGWGTDNPTFRQMFTSFFIPEGTPEHVQWFNELQRRTTSPENALRLREMFSRIDVRPLLEKVTAPTLVLHCRDDAVVPFDKGRRIAAGIPGAHFVPLEGHDHLILEHDPAWPRFLAEVRAFLAA